jgi:hypothetical protein
VARDFAGPQSVQTHSVLSAVTKRPGREADHSPPSDADIIKCGAVLCSWQHKVRAHSNFTFQLPQHSPLIFRLPNCLQRPIPQDSALLARRCSRVGSAASPTRYWPLYQTNTNSRDSSVGTVARLWAGGSGVRIPAGARRSRPTLVPTQHSTQWVPGFFQG